MLGNLIMYLGASESDLLWPRTCNLFPFACQCYDIASRGGKSEEYKGGGDRPLYIALGDPTCGQYDVESIVTAPRYCSQYPL